MLCNLCKIVSILIIPFDSVVDKFKCFIYLYTRNKIIYNSNYNRGVRFIIFFRKTFMDT